MAWDRYIPKVLLFLICGAGGCLIAGRLDALAGYSWSPWAGAGAGIASAAAALLAEKLIRRRTLKVLLGATLGLVIGLIVSKLISYAFTGLENNTVRTALFVVLSSIFGYMGMVLGSVKIEELGLSDWAWLMRGTTQRSHVKILDTSVIIDGRIADVVETGFIDGTLIIPEFVLQELQHIADSVDQTRRARGRRGLDVLKRLQQEKLVEVIIDRQNFENLNDVDAKLVALALRLNAQVVTNDYNLSKVAEVQGVRVLSINQLANSLKPVVLPGEILRLQILREGKEQGQGIAYLEDGTMVVVENASKFLGKEVEVSVTSILQTTAGRLVFTTLKEGEHGRHH